MGSKKKSNGTPCGRGTAAEARSCADHRHPPAIRGGPRPCTERVGGARRKPRRGQGKRRGVAAATASPAAPAAAPQDKPLPLPDQHEAAHPTPGVYNAGKEEGLGQSSSGVGRTKEDVMRTDEQELPQGGVPEQGSGDHVSALGGLQSNVPGEVSGGLGLGRMPEEGPTDAAGQRLNGQGPGVDSEAFGATLVPENAPSRPYACAVASPPPPAMARKVCCIHLARHP